MKMRNSHVLHLLFLTFTVSLNCQSDPNNLVFNGNKESIKQNFTKAEVEYRKAISKSEIHNKASHNLGNLLFENKNYDEAIQEYFKTQKNSQIDLEKHSAFHNLGNTYMKKKDYAQAVEAYKNALRNNSEDDETRYNYALAKKFLEGDKRQNSQNSDDSEQEKKDKSDDQKENKDEDQNSDQDSDSEKDKPKDQQDKMIQMYGPREPQGPSGIAFGFPSQFQEGGLASINNPEYNMLMKASDFDV